MFMWSDMLWKMVKKKNQFVQWGKLYVDNNMEKGWVKRENWDFIQKEIRLKLLQKDFTILSFWTRKWQNNSMLLKAK